jgi:tight adherence protein C
VTFFLLSGLALTGLSCVLVLRSVSLARARQRETLAQIGAYGFHSSAPETAPSRDLRHLVHAAASAAGARLVARLEGQRERRLRRQLDSAGLYRTSVATFLGYRVLAAASPIVIPLLAGPTGGLGARGILGTVSLAVMGWFVPSVLVKRRARLRVEQIDREVPELVDLLVTTVEAGVAFASGLQLAARSIRGPLGDELRLVLQEQSLGLTPNEALRNLAARVETPALRAFTQALIQGESLGVSIGKVLRDLAIDMRKRRRQAAEERAQKTPTKILFPLVALILPAMFILTLGPVLVRVVQFFGES